MTELQQMHDLTTVPASYSTLQAPHVSLRRYAVVGNTHFDVHIYFNQLAADSQFQENGAGQYSAPVVSHAVTTTSKVSAYTGA